MAALEAEKYLGELEAAEAPGKTFIPPSSKL